MTREEAINVIVKSDLFWCRPTDDEKTALYLAQIALGASLPEQTERKTGHWLKDPDRDGYGRYICSECEEPFEVKEVMMKPMWKFCPNCGANLSGEEE